MAGELVTGPGLIQWGNLLIGPDPYRWTRLDGWEEMPPLDDASAMRSGTHGADVGQLLAQTRTVTLDGIVRAAPSAMGSAVSSLAAGTSLRQDEQPLVVQLDERGPLLAFGRVVRRRVPVERAYRVGTVLGMSVQWVCSDPRRYALAEQSAASGLPQPEAGLDWGAPASRQVNLALNPSLETNLTTTQTYGPDVTRARITTDAAVGSACVQHTYTAASASSGSGTTWSIAAVGGGRTVYVSARIKVTAGVSQVRMVWRSGTTTLTTQLVSTPAAGSWAEVTGSYTLAPGETCDRVGVSAYGSGSGVTWLADGCIAATDPIPAYGDGTTAGWSWTGTAHASTSVGPAPGSEPGLDWTSGAGGLDWGGGGSTGDMACVNSGTAPAHPIVEIAGPCQTPSVTDLATGRRLEYDLALAAGDVLTVDTAAGTVTLAGADRLSSVTNRSVPEQTFTLEPGSTSLGFRSLDTTPTAGTCTVRWRSAYW